MVWRIRYLRFQSRKFLYPEDAGIKFLRNVGTYCLVILSPVRYATYVVTPSKCDPKRQRDEFAQNVDGAVHSEWKKKLCSLFFRFPNGSASHDGI
jgi:hypothetical protein